MRKYEMLLVLPGTLDEKESEVKTNEVVSLINEFGQEVVLTSMGKNRLAYPINHVRYGYFYTVIFSAEPENIQKIEKKIKIIRDLLRAIISHYNKSLEGAQKISNFNEAFRTNQNNNATNFKKTEVEPSKAEPAEATTLKEEKVEKEVEKTTITKEKVNKPKEDESKEAVVNKEKVEDSTDNKKTDEKSSIDLKDIDKKLDEFLSEDSIKI